MKIYTNTFDVAFPAPHRFWVAPYSDFAIGVKIVKGGEPLASNFTVKQGSTTLEPQDDKIDGFTIFTVQSGATGSVEYTIEIEGLIQKQKLYQIVTDSTVFDVGSGGGGDVPADVATKTWVNSQISDLVDESELTAYATKDELTAYATTDDLTAYATTDSLTAYAEKSDLTDYVETDDLTAYATVDSLSAKVTAAKDGNAPLPTTMKSIYETAWATVSANADANTVYVVLPDPS